MKIILVVAARPNFMKGAPLWRAMLSRRDIFNPMLVHTGQHYDSIMSTAFFRDLELPDPDVHLGIGSGSHAEQTGGTMVAFEGVLQEHKPHLALVVGDVNATLACALAAVKLHVPVAHVEAGLRSFDRQMPEEINRLLTDRIARFLFTPSRDADTQLLSEGIPSERIFRVGNIMVDSLLHQLAQAERSPILSRLGLANGGPNGSRPYAVLTLHRPSNVDHPHILRDLFLGLREVGRHLPVIFPVHPGLARDSKSMDWSSTADVLRGFRLLNPAVCISSIPWLIPISSP